MLLLVALLLQPIVSPGHEFQNSKPQIQTIEHLKVYSFVALVTVTNIKDVNPANNAQPLKELNVRVEELFKGNQSSVVYTSATQTSLPIQENEKWIVFCKVVDGKLMFEANGPTTKFVYPVKHDNEYEGTALLLRLRKLLNDKED